MTTHLNWKVRATGLPLAMLGTLFLSACGGGGIGGEPPQQVMNLSQVSLNCQQQPGENCPAMQATVMLYSSVTDQRPLWEEKPAASGNKVFDKVKPIKQADGSWLMDFTVKPDLAEGRYTGTVDFSIFTNPFPGTPNYQPRTANYSITVAGLKGNLTALQALPGVGDWEGNNGNAAHTGLVPVTLDASKFSRRWTWKDNEMTRSTMTSPVVSANGFVYLNLADSKEDPANALKSVSSSRLMALSETDSSIVWKTEQQFGSYGGGFGASGVSGNRLVTMDTQFAYTYDAISGAKLSIVKQPNTNSLLLSVSSYTPPTLFGGTAYVGGTNDVISLDPSTGANRWSTSLRLPLFASASDWTPAVNATTVYSNVAGKLTAFDIGSGALRFSVAVPGQGSNSVSQATLRQAPVLVDDNTVLLINQLPAAGRAFDNSLTLVDVAGRTVRWTVNGQFTTQPVVAGGVFYVGNDSGKVLEARSVQDGKVLWTWPLTDVDESGFRDNLIVTSNLVFVAGAKGTYAVDLATHKAVWCYRASGSLSLSRQGVLYINSYGNDSNVFKYLTAINLR